MKLLTYLLLGTVIQLAYGTDTDCLGEGDAQSILSEPVNEQAKLVLDNGERAFAVHLIKSIFKDFNATGINKNIFISPASIYQTLMLAYMGSAGLTEQEIAQTLGFDGDVSKQEVMKNYLFERAFQAIRDRDPDLGYELTHANKFFFDLKLDLSECLKLVLQDELEALDFSKTEKARSHINQWVKEKTKKKINELLPYGALNGGSRVALVNAAYFKGQWGSKFDSKDTKKDIFYVDRGSLSRTKFMEQKGKFNYYTSEELRAHVLEMPYIGDEVSMVIILPPFENNSLFQTVDRLTPETLQGVMNEVRSGYYSVDDLTVKIPRFRIEQSFELAKTLQKLGVSSLFDPISSDLSGFLRKDSKERVSLQSALHKSFIEVNEEGSEAAAATALFGFRSARPLFHTEFIANHPFLFLIYDKEADTILFFGVYQDPKL